MNKKEIYEYLNYNGKYTKDIEKKLKKLIKRFHPDKNKNDKSTILVLYEVKKELENNVVDTIYYQNEKSKVTDKNETIFYNLEPLIIRMIEILRVRRDRKEQEISKIQRKINYHYKKRMGLTNSKNEIDLHIEEISKKYNNFSSRTTTIFLIINFVLFLITMSFLNLLTFLIFLLSIFITIFYFLLRHEYFIKLNKEMEKRNSEKHNYEIKIKIVNEKIKALEDVCVNLKFEKNAISNDIQFYNYELFKILNSSYNIVKKSDKTYKKSI